MSKLDIAVWDILFYKIDEEGEEIRNPDGTVNESDRNISQNNISKKCC